MRKLERPASIRRIKLSNSVGDVDLDVIHNEFRSKDNCLSFWIANDKTEIEDIGYAIALASSKTDAFTMVIFSDEYLNKDKIKTSYSNGKTGYKKFQKNHIDFINLTYKHIEELVKTYRDAKEPVPNCEYKLTKEQIETKIKTLAKDELDNSMMNDDLLLKVSDLRKYITD